jgi:hypothetical protein
MTLQQRPAALKSTFGTVPEHLFKDESGNGGTKRQTRSVTRQPGKSVQIGPCLDHLDFMLNSTYQHGTNETFPEKEDVYLQPLTVGVMSVGQKASNMGCNYTPLPTARRNVEDPLCKEAQNLRILADGTCCYFLRSVPERSHPIRYGGLTMLKNVSSLKLAISSHLSPQTKNGFSRKVDGSFYRV